MSSPFGLLLGQSMDGVSPAVRRHLTAERPTLHAGVLRRLWRRGPWGWIAARLLHLDGDPDLEPVRFELRNELVAEDGEVLMLWQRTHYLGSRRVSGVGRIRSDAGRGVLVDSIGNRKWLEVELVPRVDGGALVMSSSRQWIRVGGIRLRLPRLLFGSARTREWEETGESLGLSLTLEHPLFGAYAGYEALLCARD